MKPEKQQEIALMRYGAIAPLIAGLDQNYPSKTAFYTEISNKGLVGPDGHVHHYAPATIEKWYLGYQKHGFDALVPKSRADAGTSRKLDDDLQEQIRYFKTNYPRMSAAAIYRQLKTDGSIINGQVSESTVCRFVNQLLFLVSGTLLFSLGVPYRIPTNQQYVFLNNIQSHFYCFEHLFVL